MKEAVKRVDLHGKNLYQSKIAIEAALRRATSPSIYRIRLIHGYRQGTRIKDYIWEHYSEDERVIRIEAVNQGMSELVLQEWDYSD